jgi:hypothetical protein
VIGEINLFGVFVPTFLVYAVVAFAVLSVLRPLLEWSGAYRLVWHEPLVNCSLLVIIMAVVVAYLPGWVS